MKFKRIFLIVIDSVGCGYTSKSHLYGDEGANTLSNIAENGGGLNIPVMQKLGLGNLTDIKGCPKTEKPLGVVCKLDELSVGKDTMTGHWEMMGLEITNPFKTFTDTGFPQELLDELTNQTGYEFIGNISASGTEIIKDLGEEHLKTRKLIVYTSADSVLQIAANEDLIGLEELYRVCEKAREITLKDDWKVGRIIARPFVGDSKDNFKRTTNRHDYALKPFGKTVLNSLEEHHLATIGVGKIGDIFDMEGIQETYKNTSNHNGMEHILNILDKDFTGLCFANLVDFDALYGHRRDVLGYKACLEEFDKDLACVIDKLKDDDLLIITADHGNDPTWHGTDHTREYVPMIAYNKNLTGKTLDPRRSFADLGATIADNFDVEMPKIGKSFLDELK